MRGSLILVSAAAIVAAAALLLLRSHDGDAHSGIQVAAPAHAVNGPGSSSSAAGASASASPPPTRPQPSPPPPSFQTDLASALGSEQSDLLMLFKKGTRAGASPGEQYIAQQVADTCLVAILRLQQAELPGVS